MDIKYLRLAKQLENNGVSAEEAARYLFAHYQEKILIEECGDDIGLPIDRVKIAKYERIKDAMADIAFGGN